MRFKTLYQNVNSDLYSMMVLQSRDNLQAKSENILKLLQENKRLLKNNKNKNLTIYILTAIVSVLFAYFILKEWFPNAYIILIGATLFFSSIVTLITIRSVENKIDASILLVDGLSQKGWSFSTLNPTQTWDEWNYIYPFISKGDMDDAIALRVYGNYEEFSFCYFDYDYTIEVEEEVAYEDSDGETYFVTEYHNEYYTESGIAIDVDNNLPFMYTTAQSSDSDAMKFSYIELNERVSVYSTSENEAAVFFSPSMQRIFVNIYSYFPDISISIRNNYVFINFGSNLTNIPRTINFDDELLSYIKGNRLANTIEGIMQSLLPMLRAAN